MYVNKKVKNHNTERYKERKARTDSALIVTSTPWKRRKLRDIKFSESSESRCLTSKEPVMKEVHTILYVCSRSILCNFICIVRIIPRQNGYFK